MLIDVHRLRTFVVAAEERTFTHAARVLSFSQSAVSQQIRELEDELGVRLFERRGRAVALTPAGERLLPLALGILRDCERAAEAMSSYRGLPQGVLRIGATDTPGIYLMPQILGRFSQAQPAVRATLAVASAEETLRAARDGELDLAVLEVEPPRGRIFGWTRRPFMEDELVLAVPGDHPWAKRGKIHVEDLTEGTYIGRRPGSPARQLGREIIAAQGLNPASLNVRFELDNTEGLKRAVKARLGLAWLSRLSIAQDIELGELAAVEVEGMVMRYPLWVALPERAEEAAAPLGLDVLLQLLHAAAGVMPPVPVGTACVASGA